MQKEIVFNLNGTRINPLNVEIFQIGTQKVEEGNGGPHYGAHFIFTSGRTLFFRTPSQTEADKVVRQFEEHCNQVLPRFESGPRLVRG